MASSSIHMPATQDTVPALRAPLSMEQVEQGELTLSEIEREMIHYADMQDCTIPALCMCLEATVAWNDQRAPPAKLTFEMFEGDVMPVSVSEYVIHILKYSKCSTCSIVIGLLYLERLKKRERNMRVTSTNVQRLLLVATLTAAKFCDDLLHGNRRWAKIGGMSLQELNALEVDFLFNIQFDLAISTEQYVDFVKKNLLVGFQDQSAVKIAPEKPTAVTLKEVKASPSEKKPSAKGPSKHDLSWLDEATTEKLPMSQITVPHESSSAQELCMDGLGDASDFDLGDKNMGLDLGLPKASSTAKACQESSGVSKKSDCPRATCELKRCTAHTGQESLVTAVKPAVPNVVRNACVFLFGDKTLQAERRRSCKA